MVRLAAQFVGFSAKPGILIVHPRTVQRPVAFCVPEGLRKLFLRARPGIRPARERQAVRCCGLRSCHAFNTMEGAKASFYWNSRVDRRMQERESRGSVAGGGRSSYISRSLAKAAGLTLLRACGAYHAAARLGRRNRLLILGFHGISLADEHEWNPGLYITAAQLRRRMELLRRWEANVLPLDEAVERLQAGSLPPRSTVITFDDGFADFAMLAAPILREFQYPVTVYLTTHYCRYREPVFNLAVQYLFWKSQAVEADLRPVGISMRLSGAQPEQRQGAAQAVLEHFGSQSMSPQEREEAASTLASLLGVDYEQIRRRRMLQILSPDEVAELSRAGVDFQLHTHRHRVPLDRALFLREIEDNRRQLLEMTGQEPSHFCYPSGVYAQDFLPWLEEAGVRSAVTCELGAARPNSHRLLLPRLLDDSRVSTLDFEAWLCGVRS